jgi:hypothetical protein
VIYVCGPCNTRANERVDRPLVALDDVRRARAQIGLRDPRTNEPATFSETFDSQDGIRLRATWSMRGVDARVIPIEIPRPGTIVSDVFVDPRDAEEHERKQAERAAKRGQTIGPPLSAEEWTEAPEPRFHEAEEIVLVARAGGRQYPAWVWPAATAKIVLGCLCDGARVGAWPAKTVNALIVHGLRMLAFDHLYSPDLWRGHDIWTAPRRPAATHLLAGWLASDEHAVAVYDEGGPGRSPLAQVVLFGQRLLELPLPGLRVRWSCAWLFSAADRRVVRDTPEAITATLLHRRRIEHQLALVSAAP